MARRSEHYPGNRRTRTTVSIPETLMDLVPDTENFSAIVTQLLDENIDKISDVGIDEIRNIRTLNAKHLILEKIEALKANISKSIVSDCSEELDNTFKQLDSRIAETRELLDSMGAMKVYFIAHQRYLKKELQSVVEGEIQKSILGLTEESEEEFDENDTSYDNDIISELTEY